ncbi:PPR4 [Symbiodinium natans]|uniref:PPR4 protein n=1 Tax=Symbiodinium natans TaxID=878477 RepID=A0A812P3Z0_9DINO|nr:PPR4 [Symbiodinium natans]
MWMFTTGTSVVMAPWLAWDKLRCRHRGFAAALAVLYLGALRQQPCGFGVRRQGQSPLRLVREQAGIQQHVQVDTGKILLSKAGKLLLSKVTEAGARGDWQQIRRLFAGYGGSELPVFHAVLHHALNCGQLKEGAKVYDELCRKKVSKDAPTYSTAMKIFAELGQSDVVREIWDESRTACELDEFLAGARIVAAAREGDVKTAADVLDEMNRTGVPIDVGHVTTAIRACWEASGRNDNAAGFLFRLLDDLGLQPNIATYTCLVGAYKQASLRKVQAVVQQMKESSIQADMAFIETYLTTVLRKPKEEKWTLQELVATKLRTRSPERLAAARGALAEFRAAGISLTTLSARIGRALDILESAK